MLNEVMIKYAELLESQTQSVEDPDLDQVELLPNRFAELDIGLPAFMDSEIYARAADEDTDVLYEKKFPHEPEDMIEKAHPKSVFVSPSLGNGGLVENQNEQQETIIQMINKRPRGQHVGVYASIVEDLVKIANELEDVGQNKIVAQVDEILAEFTNPQKKKINKRAALPLLGLGIGAVLGLLGGGTFVGLHGAPEGLVEDASDVLDVAEEFPSAFPEQRQYAQEIYTGARRLNELSVEVNRLFSARAHDTSVAIRIDQILDEIKAIVKGLTDRISLLRGVVTQTPYVGELIGYTARLESHLNDYATSFTKFEASLAAIGHEVQQQMSRARSQPRAPDVPATPQPAAPQPLDEQQQEKVKAFLEQNVKPGVTDTNFEERLQDFADRVVRAIEKRTGVTVENLTGDRLQYADVNKLRRLLNLAKEPLAAIQYVPKGMETE